VPAAEPARDWVAILDADPSLAAAVAPATRAAALPACVAGVRWLDAGPWQPAADAAWSGGLGLLVLGGFLARHVDVVGRPATELLGPGDLLRPWERDRTEPFSSAARWHALEPCCLAVLDARVSTVICRWPDLVEAIVGRAVGRSREHAVGLAVGQIPNMRLRVLVVLWHIAHRFGERRDDGTLIPMRLTHELLANLTSAQRASVSHALTALRGRGLIDRTPDGQLVLRGDAPSALSQLRGSLASAPRL
jgi:CRP/FNR family cyclic AMP-dependent transcriptional regulator